LAGILSAQKHAQQITKRVKECTSWMAKTPKRVSCCLARLLSQLGDRQRAALGGFSPAGDLMIHGIKNRLGWLGRLHRFIDWTDGCVAVTSAEMDQIWDLVPIGTPIEIRP
jgi:hypothetical protein